MASIYIDIQQGINAPLLDQQLRTALPDFNGISASPFRAEVVFNVDPVPDADIAQATAICAAHDPTQRTTAQQQAATVDAAAAHVVSTLLPAMGTLAAYYQELTPSSPDVISGAAQMKLFSDFATLLTGLKAWITANN